MAGNRFRQVIEVVMKGAGKTASDSKKVQKGLQGVARDAAKIGAAFYAAKGGINATQGFVNSALQVENLEPAFKKLGREIGFTSNAMQKLQDATNGTMSEVELMRISNQAMTLGVVDSEDAMANLFDTAQRLGKSLGVDTVSAIDSLVTGMGRQSIMMLDNLGIIVDSEKAYKDYAEQLGTTADKLTDSEKKQAFNNAALEAAQEKVALLGEENETSADAFARFEAASADFSASLGEFLLPMLTDIANAATTVIGFINDLFGLGDEDIKSKFELGSDRLQEIKNISDESQQQKEIIDLLETEWKFFGDQLDKTNVTMEDLDFIQKQLGRSAKSWAVEFGGASSDIIEDAEELAETIKIAAGLGGWGTGIEEVVEANLKLEKHNKALLHLEENRNDAIIEKIDLNRASIIEEQNLAKIEAKRLERLEKARDERKERIFDRKERNRLAGLYFETLTKINEQEIIAFDLQKQKDINIKSENESREEQRTVYDELAFSHMVLADVMAAGDEQQLVSIALGDVMKNSLKVQRKELDKFTEGHVNSAMAIGAAQLHVGQAVADAAGAFIIAKTQEAIAAFIADAFKNFGILGGIVGAGAAGAVGSLMSGAVQSVAAAEGMNEIVTEPTLILAGEEGAEYVNIEPTQNEGAGMGNGSQIVFQGNVLSKDFIEDEAIPMIRDAIRRGHTI